MGNTTALPPSICRTGLAVHVPERGLRRHFLWGTARFLMARACLRACLHIWLRVCLHVWLRFFKGAAGANAGKFHRVAL